MQISLLGIQEAYQKAGIGSKLIKAMEEQVIRENVKRLRYKGLASVDFYLEHAYKMFGELEELSIIGTKKYYSVK